MNGGGEEVRLQKAGSSLRQNFRGGQSEKAFNIKGLTFKCSLGESSIYITLMFAGGI